MATLTLSPAGAAFIARFEGFSATPYRCPADHPTIGYGHVIRMFENFQGISQPDALSLLQQDAQREAAPVARALTVELPQHQQDALISLAFNCGSGAIRKSTLLRMLNSGAVPQAADEFLRWNRIGKVESKGLTQRRHAERHLWLTGKYEDA